MRAFVCVCVCVCICVYVCNVFIRSLGITYHIFYSRVYESLHKWPKTNPGIPTNLGMIEPAVYDNLAYIQTER